MSEVNICPFCATTVPIGYSVCSGCGANYRTNIAGGIWGAIVATVLTFIFAGLGQLWGGFYFIAFLMVLGGIGHLSSLKPQWYRRNS